VVPPAPALWSPRARRRRSGRGLCPARFVCGGRLVEGALRRLGAARLSGRQGAARRRRDSGDVHRWRPDALHRAGERH